jgi:hypothetical protein
MNNLTGICHSCLGRSTYGLTNELLLKREYVLTKGCPLHDDDPIGLLDRCAEIARRANHYLKEPEKSTNQFWQAFIEGDEGKTISMLWDGFGDERGVEKCQFPRDIFIRDYLNYRLPRPLRGEDFDQWILEYREWKEGIDDRLQGIKQSDLLAHMFYLPLLRLFVKNKFKHGPEAFLTDGKAS